jgi:MFS family permease
VPTATTGSLWREPNFARLWAGQTISQLGSQVTFLALPLTAILALDAGPAETGALTAAGALPSLLVGLHAGAMVDRRQRLPIMIGGDLGRAALLALVPLAWAMDRLSIGLLVAVVALVGLLTLFFDVAYQALLPAIVPRERLVEGNAKLELSFTAAQIAGPTLAGGLIRLLTAPIAIAVDALSFVASGLVLAGIRVEERIARPPERGRRIGAEIVDGLRLVVGDERLRAITGARGLLELFNAMLEAVFLLYLVRALGLGPGLIGAIFAVGSAGFALGALLPARAAGRFGVGATTIGALALLALSDLLVPLAAGSKVVVVPLLVGAQFLFGVGLTVFNVNQVSLRQAVVPDGLQGRAAATVRVLGTGLIPLGALLGGLLGEAIGLRPTLILAALGEGLAAVWLWRSPVRSLRDLPASDTEPG